jgi:hypothetical protein
MKIILNNGTELVPILINGYRKYIQGINRDCLEFYFASNVTFAQLDELFGDPINTSKIILQDSSESYLHENYTIRDALKYVPFVLSEATDTTPEVAEMRFSVVMAQKTYVETQIDSLRDTVDVLVLEGLGV